MADCNNKCCSSWRDSHYLDLWQDFVNRVGTESSICTKKNELGNMSRRQFPHGSSRTTRNPIFLTLIQKIIPTVHAEQGQMTISEKVTSRVPQLHVSDDDIETLLSKETGRDRIREMFTR